MNNFRYYKRFLKLITFLLMIVFVTMTIFMNCFAQNIQQNNNWPKRISIGAAPIGGTFYMAASALARVINATFPDITVSVQVTSASKHNVQLIQAGEIDFGLTSADYAYEAQNGIGSFEGYKQDKVRTLIPAYYSNYILVTLQKNPIYTFKDLKGKTFDINVVGGANNKFSRLLLEYFDMSKDVKITEMDIQSSTRALQQGGIDALLTGHPAAAVQELAISEPVRIFSLAEEELNNFVKDYPMYSIIDMPSGSYKGQEEDVSLPGIYLTYICHQDLPDDFIYAVVKAMYEHQDLINTVIPIVANSYNPETVINANLSVHPGSIRYFEEIGIEIPDKLKIGN